VVFEWDGWRWGLEVVIDGLLEGFIISFVQPKF
jgi:hypothetical protein